MIGSANLYICPVCGVTIDPEWVHLCPGNPSATLPATFRGHTCPTCHVWVPSGELHFCIQEKPRQELLLLDIIRLLERIAAKLEA